MIMLSILAMAALVFISRYLFLEPRLPIRLNSKAQRLLAYSSPAVLTSIWGPIVFIQDDEVALSLTNPYLIGALVAAFLVWKTKNVLWTTIISMAVFLLFKLSLG
ncbi:branched-chain amino acid ABC transporter [Vibrio sp. MACH09]|uniref:AzlD domain-containing protein n=1 Tax=unclassified Vibrio TaxID=2614977 RepID=UPI0014938E69|nr:MULTISPECIES: AzlD domain-containing protein [unclassified Vibrio]NOI67520.1 AzlD domain-containing protein [Vibrio sp. 99-8-1]GLO63839.1 branched-chain amino acid ABC transporter [Vibrio sp. MACH09]